MKSDNQVRMSSYNNIKKRHNVQRLGFEVEFYSHMDLSEVTDYFIETGKPRWNAELDTSLNGGQPIEYNDPVLDDALDEFWYIGDRIELDEYSYIRDEYHIDRVISEFLTMLSTSNKEFVFPYIDRLKLLYNSISQTIHDGYISQDILELNKYKKIFNFYNTELINIISNLTIDIDKYYKNSTKYGIEINNKNSVSFSSAPNQIEDIVNIMNDPIMANISGGAGLHVHFGISSQLPYTFSDILRLGMNVSSSEKDIEELAGRKFNKFCKSIASVPISLLSLLDELSNDKKKVEFYHLWFTDREHGLNITNLGSRIKNTVEFRWGDSSLAFDKNKLTNYFSILSNLIDVSFTGDPRLKIGDYILEDISNSLLNKETSPLFNVYKWDKLIGKLIIPI